MILEELLISWEHWRSNIEREKERNRQTDKDVGRKLSYYSHQTLNI
jgi:hypothetical protein